MHDVFIEYRRTARINREIRKRNATKIEPYLALVNRPRRDVDEKDFRRWLRDNNVTLEPVHKPVIDARSRSIFKSERAQGRVLTNRSHAMWSAMLAMLPTGIRNRAACVVYWDYVGRSTTCPEWIQPMIDCNEQDYSVEDEALRNTLMWLGYTECMARERIKPVTNYTIFVRER